MKKLIPLDELVEKVQAEGHNASSVLVNPTQVFTTEDAEDDEPFTQSTPDEGED